MVGTLGLEGCRIAYDEAEQWLDHLIPVIDRNQHLVRDFFTANFPKITAPLVEGTYLQWVNFKALGLSPEELENFMREEAQFFTDEGYIFGEEGRRLRTHQLGGTDQSDRRHAESSRASIVPNATVTSKPARCAFHNEGGSNNDEKFY